MCGVYFCTLCPSIGPKERSRQALDRLPLFSNFLTSFWMQHLDGARLSPNSVRNAVWHALNEHVCQYLRTRNPRCSTLYISLGPLARDSSCITIIVNLYMYIMQLLRSCYKGPQMNNWEAMLIQYHHHRQTIMEQMPYEDNIPYSCMQAPWSEIKHATTETASVMATTSTEQHLAHDQHM